MLLLIVILPYYVLPAQVLMILLSLSLVLTIILIQRLLMLPLFVVLPELMYILVQKSFNNFANYPNKEMTTFSIMATITTITTLSNNKLYCNNITSTRASNLNMISITWVYYSLTIAVLEKSFHVLPLWEKRICDLSNVQGIRIRFLLLMHQKCFS